MFNKHDYHKSFPSGFTYPSELRAHLEKHDKMAENTCLQCGATFASEKLLERHMVSTKLIAVGDI